MRVFLFRHGQIERSSEARLIGQTDVPLDEVGRNQGRWWRTVLEPLALPRIYCSDLIRSRETAEIIASGTGSSIVSLPELREINLGAWDGKRRDDVKAAFPDEWEERGRNLSHYRPAGGESFADLAARALPALEMMRDRPERVTAVVGHAGVNRVILCGILGMPLDHLFRIGQDYGALNIVEASGITWKVSMMNLRPESGWICAE